jgi:hypothetical protein
MPTREECLQDMLRDYPSGELSDKLRDALLSTLYAFSENQLDKMKQAGVRFWPWSTNFLVDVLPPQLAKLKDDIEIPTMGGAAARYMPAVRVVQLAPVKLSVAAFRHELAHAWDHVRALKNPRRLDDLPEAERRKVVLGDDDKHWSDDNGVPKMWKAYTQRLAKVSPTNAFDLGAKSGYSTKSSREFYAEGYAVFQSNQKPNQLNLLTYAQELYDLLEKEAKQQGLPIPDRATLDK